MVSRLETEGDNIFSSSKNKIVMAERCRWNHIVIIDNYTPWYSNPSVYQQHESKYDLPFVAET